jgi:hypothetical protein
MSKDDSLTPANIPGETATVCVSEGPTDPGCALGIGILEGPNDPHPGVCNGATVGPLPGVNPALGWSPGDAVVLFNLSLTSRDIGDTCLLDANNPADPATLQPVTTGLSETGIMDGFAFDPNDPFFPTTGSAFPYVQGGQRIGAPFSCPLALQGDFVGSKLKSALPLLDSTALGPAADLALLNNFDAQ